jgi:hypothetical protein
MKVLLDECLPRKLKRSLAGHHCLTAAEAGFAGKKNGILLALAEVSGFQVFVTVDKGLDYEQNLAGRKIAVIILHANSNRLADLLPVVPDCLAELGVVTPGQMIHVPSSGGR